MGPGKSGFYCISFNTSAINHSLPLLNVSYCVLLNRAPNFQVITVENAHKIKAKVIAEGANGPITPAADEILIANKQLVIPDIYCNSGNMYNHFFLCLLNFGAGRRSGMLGTFSL